VSLALQFLLLVKRLSQYREAKNTVLLVLWFLWPMVKGCSHIAWEHGSKKCLNESGCLPQFSSDTAV
jgi:hypothetical protein